MSPAFAEALAAGDIAAVRSAAKADLHSHSYFAAPIADVEQWLGRAIDRPPPRMDGLDGMRAYSRQAISPDMDNWPAFEFVAGAAVRHAQSDGVVLLETSFDIWAVGTTPMGSAALRHLPRRWNPSSAARSTFGRKWVFTLVRVKG